MKSDFNLVKKVFVSIVVAVIFWTGVYVGYSHGIADGKVEGASFIYKSIILP